MKTILVATDFSQAALNAANYAADMALAINADILLFHVYQLPVSYGEIPVAINLESMQDIVEKDINNLKEQLARRSGYKLKIETAVMVGTFFYELKTVCKTINPYAVVMGSQGTTAAERLFFGGHTVYAMKHLKWPIITVPPEADFSFLKKIGLACDFNDVVETIPVDEIKMLLKDFNAALHVLNTAAKEKYDPEIVFESGMLQEMLVPFKPAYHFISNENTDEGILDFVDKNGIDMLMVLPKRHGLMDKLAHRSHTKQFVLHSHVPVMALHQ